MNSPLYYNSDSDANNSNDSIDYGIPTSSPQVIFQHETITVAGQQTVRTEPNLYDMMIAKAKYVPWPFETPEESAQRIFFATFDRDEIEMQLLISQEQRDQFGSLCWSVVIGIVKRINLTYGSDASDKKHGEFYKMSRTQQFDIMLSEVIRLSEIFTNPGFVTPHPILGYICYKIEIYVKILIDEFIAFHLIYHGTITSELYDTSSYLSLTANEARIMASLQIDHRTINPPFDRAGKKMLSMATWQTFDNYAKGRMGATSAKRLGSLIGRMPMSKQYQISWGMLDKMMIAYHERRSDQDTRIKGSKNPSSLIDLMRYMMIMDDDHIAIKTHLIELIKLTVSLDIKIWIVKGPKFPVMPLQYDSQHVRTCIERYVTMFDGTKNLEALLTDLSWP